MLFSVIIIYYSLVVYSIIVYFVTEE